MEADYAAQLLREEAEGAVITAHIRTLQASLVIQL